MGAQTIEEAQLQLFKSLDAPDAPKNRGARRFQYPSVSDEMRQEFRQRLLEADPASIMEVASKYTTKSCASAECIAGNAFDDTSDVSEWKLLGANLQPLHV